MSTIQLKPFDDYPVTWPVTDIANSLIADWHRRCETASVSTHGCVIRVYRERALELIYQLQIQPHPTRGFPVLAIEAQSASGDRVTELLVDGRHIENLKGIEPHHHFFYTYGRLCAPKARRETCTSSE